MIKSQIYTDGTNFFKILGIAGDIIFLSAANAFSSSNGYYSTTEFMASGLTLVRTPHIELERELAEIKRV